TTSSLSLFFFISTPLPPTSTLFPYTTLFRSLADLATVLVGAGAANGFDATVVEADGCRFACTQRRSAGRTCDVPVRLNASTCPRSEEHTSELQSLAYLVCRLLLEKKKQNKQR